MVEEDRRHVRRHDRVVAAGLVAGFAAGLAAADGRSAAATEPYLLRYEAPAGCPSLQEVQADVAAHVYDPSRAAGARVRLRVAPSKTGDFDGELVASDRAGAQGRRAIEGKTCAEVTHALAFLAGLVLELGGRFEPAAETKPATSVERAVVPPLSAPRPASPRSAVVPVLAWTPVAAGQVRGGISNTLRPAGEIGFEAEAVRPGPWAPVVRAALVVGEGEVRGADWRYGFVLATARIEICPGRLGSARLEARPCAAGELGSMSVSSQTASRPDRSSRVWAAADAGIRLRWWIAAPFFVEIGVSAMVPLNRERYLVAPDQTAYAVPPVAARGTIGAGLRF